MKYEKSSETGSDHAEGKAIDWNDYNFPCCLKLFHFDADETPALLRTRARLLRINHMLIVFTCLWNFANNITDAIYGINSPGLRIALSIFVALFWYPISLYIFMIPYRIYMKEEDSACIFYIITALTFIFFIIWSVADFADANGWVMLAKAAANGSIGIAFFSFFTALFSTIVAVLALLNLYLFCKRED